MSHEETLISVKEGVRSFEEMANVVANGVVPPPVAMVAMGQWIVTLLGFLVRWDVVTEDEVTAMLEEIAEEVEEEAEARSDIAHDLEDLDGDDDLFLDDLFGEDKAA